MKSNENRVVFYTLENRVDRSERRESGGKFYISVHTDLRSAK